MLTSSFSLTVLYFIESMTSHVVLRGLAYFNLAHLPKMNARQAGDLNSTQLN